MSGPVRMKICGLTRLEDATLAADLGAWAVGLVLWPGSRRACDLAEAGRIAAQLRRRVEIAGVFVNQPLDEVTRLADLLSLSLVQLHGDEGPMFADEVARRTGARVIKAAGIRGFADVQAIQAYRTSFHLVDTHHEELRGGTGQTFDWTLLSRRNTDVPLIVSGGLGPDNVAAAIAATQPYAVDVASGVEAAPGIKDPEKLAAFAHAAGVTPPVRRTHPEPAAAGPRPVPGRPASA